MSSKVRRVLIVLSSVLLVICVLISALAVTLPRRSFPKTTGQVKLEGLDAQVDIYRDAYGVPHIYAQTTHDLFYAQGYVHAQDRFWQMDFWRHISAGRLSEMFGEDQLEKDIFLRTLGLERVARQELDLIDPLSLQILQAYAAGVNAYLNDHQGSAISLEYAILGLLNADYQPEPWQPLNSLAWAKVMAWDLGGNMDGEIERTVLLKTLNPQQLADLVPAYPADQPVILPNFELSGVSTVLQTASLSLADFTPAFEALSHRLVDLNELLSPAGNDIGSNNWVIAGSRTSTGMPLLANDPHLGEQMPSIWYEVGLHCTPKDEACPVNVTGFSFAGAPGVIIGHNEHIAWGMTNVGPDVQDLYIERINPANPNQYEVNGQWVDMEMVNETVLVSGKDPVTLTVRYTRHGPLIWEGEQGEIAEKWGIDLPDNFAIALRWTALEPSRTFPAVWKINIAKNWEEFRRAASEFDVPSQNFVYADTSGNIGYQTPGRIPIRASGDGTLPVPGWTDEYAWTGYIPFEQLPYTFNPPEGYIATANNPIVGASYPYLITKDFDYGFRAQRIVEMIEGAPGPVDIAYIQKIQGDNRDQNAASLVPLLMQLPLNDARLEKARRLLQGWDFQAHMDQAAPALFNAFWRHLLAFAFRDDLPEDYFPTGGSRWFMIVNHLALQPDSFWWDDHSTPAVEKRDDIFLKAFSAAVDELEASQGKDPTRWQWGEMHVIIFTNQALGTSGISLIEKLFNRGPYTASGNSSVVNNTGWDAADDEFGYQIQSLPSMRMIVDLSNLDNSITTHTTGQSGHSYHPHYNDMVDLWRLIRYHPMLWDPIGVEASAEGHLKLVP